MRECATVDRANYIDSSCFSGKSPILQLHRSDTGTDDTEELGVNIKKACFSNFKGLEDNK